MTISFGKVGERQSGIFFIGFGMKKGPDILWLVKWEGVLVFRSEPSTAQAALPLPQHLLEVFHHAYSQVELSYGQIQDESSTLCLFP